MTTWTTVTNIISLAAHKLRHQKSGADEISVAGLSGLLADDQHVLDAEVTAVAVAKSLYDAYTILMATDDDTPIPLTVAAQTLIGRITGGTIASLTVAQCKTLLDWAADIATHSALATGIHGVAASTVASVANIATHAALTATHGVAGTIAGLADIVTHAALATGVHGAGSNYLLSTGDISRKNAIINGNGQINQRATVYTLVKDTYGISSDRFYGMATGTLVSAGILTNSTNGFFFSNATLTGTGIIYFRYRMEAQDAVQFKNQTASFNCIVYQDTGAAKNYTVYIRKANAADNFSAVTAISNSGAISIPHATDTALPYLAIAMGDCSNGIEIEIKIECGAITTKNFVFRGCQFELGSIATPFEFRPFGQELALCQRYYEKSYDLATSPGTNTANGCVLIRSSVTGVYTVQFQGLFQTRKRASPTVKYYSQTGEIDNIYDGTAPGNIAVSSYQNVGENTRGWPVLAANLNDGNDGRLQYTADAEL